MAASAATITAQLLDWHGVGRPRGASAAGRTGGRRPPPEQRRCRRKDPAASVITLMDEVCAKSQTQRHVAQRMGHGSLARCPKTKAEILSVARSEDGVCDSSHARTHLSRSRPIGSRRIWHASSPFGHVTRRWWWQWQRRADGMKRNGMRLLLHSAALALSPPSLPQPLPRRCYRVDLMMVLAQHHPSKATARAAAAAATEHLSGLG